jgi:hypothetical protein
MLMPKSKEEYQRILEMGRDMMAKGKVLVDMAKAAGVGGDYEPPEGDKETPEDTGGESRKSMLVASLKRKYQE